MSGETAEKLCALCHTESVEHGQICETCKSLPEMIVTDQPVDAYTTKRCSKCGEFKELEQFDKDRHTKDGKTGTCKQCRRLMDKEAHKAKMAKRAISGMTCEQRFIPPEQLPEREYKVTIDFSDCPWLLAYLEGESLLVSLQIKRRLIDSMSDGELRSWLLTGIVG